MLDRTVRGGGGADKWREVPLVRLILKGCQYREAEDCQSLGVWKCPERRVYKIFSVSFFFLFPADQAQDWAESGELLEVRASFKKGYNDSTRLLGESLGE